MLVLGLIIGLGVGILVTTIISNRKVVDELLVDTSDKEDGPYMFLNLRNTPKTIMNKKYVTLKVRITNFLSQE